MSFSEHPRPLFTALRPHLHFVRCKFCHQELRYFQAVKVRHGRRNRTFFDFYYCVNPLCKVGKKVRKVWRKAR